MLNIERCGWCVDVSADAIKTALCQFFDLDENELKQMGLRGRRLVEENFDTRRNADEYIKMYTRLCK